MSPIRVALLCLVSLAMLPVSQLYAQGGGAPPAVDQVPGRVVLEPSQDMLGTATYSGGAPVGPFGGYLFFRKDIGQGVGYDDGYTNVGWFQPMQLVENGILFGQAQFFVTDAGEWGGNLGGGYRHYFPSIDRLVGGYGFYDADESSRGINYDQLSIGFETLGRRWDFRANGYFPLEKDVTMLGIAGPFGGIPSFIGRNLLFSGSAYFEKAMPGADAEFGLPIFDPSAFGRLRAYFGAYVYDSEEKNPAGVRVRLESHLNQYFTVGAAFLHDDIHGGQATIAVDVRSWSKKLPPITNYQPTQEPKLYLPVVRQNRVATHTFIDEFSALALGNDGRPLDFVWVDNSNPNAGDGTFENPFHDMPGSAPGADYIFVRHGDSSLNNPVLGGIVLEDGQTMFGEGFRFGIPVAGTKFGVQPLGGVYNIDTLIPEWDRSGNYPFISNPGGNVITLASNNTVGGFNIISSAGHGITGANINNFELFRLNIGNANPAFGNGGAAIALTNASGIGTIDDFTFLNNAGGGLIINNTNTAPLLLAVEGSTAISPNVVGGAVGLRLTANNSLITADIQNYLNSGSGTGALLTASNGGVLNFNSPGNTFDNTTAGHGIQVGASSGGRVNLDLLDTTAVNAFADGLNVTVASGGVVSGSFVGTTLGGSSFSDAGGMGIRLIADSSPSALNSLFFDNTTVNNSGSDGLHVELTGGSLFNVQFQDGQINNSGGNGVATLLDGASTLNLAVSDTPITPSGLNGFLFDAQNNSVLNATFTDVNLSLAGLNGIVGTLNTGATANVSFTDALIDQSGEHGLFLTALGGSTFNGMFDTVSLSDSNQSGGAFDGINTVVDGIGTVVNIDMVDTQVDNTMGGGGQQQNALDFLVDNGGELNFTIASSGIFLSTPSSMLNSEEDGVLGRVHNASVANVTFDGTAIDNSGSSGAGHGFNLLVDSGATLNVGLINGSSVNESADNGVLFIANDPGTSGLLMVDASTIDDNGGHGIQAEAHLMADLMIAVLDGSSVSDNGLDGMNLLADGGSSLTAVVEESTIDDNGLGGIVAAVTGAATTLDLTVDDSTVDNNQGGDGINLSVDAGTLNASVENGSSVSGNDGSGIALTAVNGSTSSLTVEDSTVDDNVNGFGIHLDISGGSTHVAEFTDSSASGNALDGVFVDARNAGTAVDLTADGMDADDNGGHGWNLQIHDDALLSALISNSSGSGNGGNGFLLEATGAGTIVVLDTTGGNQFDENTDYGALVNATGIAELTAVVGGGSLNGLGGVEINADTIGIIHNVGVVGSLIVANQGHGVLLNLDNNPEIRRITVAGNSINDNTGLGLWIDADNSVIDDLSMVGADGLVLIDDNGISRNLGGEGVLVDLLNTPVNGTILVSNNGISSNASHGLNFELDGSPIDTLDIRDNSGGTSSGLFFIIDGNTFNQPWMITNTAPGGADIIGFQLDLAPTAITNPPGYVWDSNAGTGAPFQPLMNSDVLTGLVSVNGNLITAGTNPLEDDMGVVLPGGGIVGGTTLIDLVFNDFNFGETFVWDLDVDEFGDNFSTVNGDDLIGSTILVTFSTGPASSGTLVAVPGNPDAAQFVDTLAMLGGISDNGGDGIRINQSNGSHIANLNISGNIVDNNASHGIEFLVSDSNLPGPGNPATITGNEITANGQGGAGNGIQLVNPDTGAAGPGGTAIGMNFTANTITGHENGAGVNIQLNANSTEPGAPHQFNFDGNDVSDNAQFGVHYLGTQDSVADLNFGQADLASYLATLTAAGIDTAGIVAVPQNTFNANGDAGVAIELINNAVGNLNVANSAFNNNIDGANANFAGEGLAIRLNHNATLPNATIGDGALVNTVFSGNASHGFLLFADAFSQADGLTFQNSDVLGNGGDGLHLERIADGQITNATIAGNLIDGNISDGIDIIARGGDTADTYTINDNTISNNTNRGISLFVEADADLIVNSSFNMITGNGNDGIQARFNSDVTDSPTITTSIVSSLISGNGGDGVDFIVPHDVFIDDSEITFNSGRGVFLNGPSLATDDILNSIVSDNGGVGIEILANTGINSVVIDNNDLFRNGNDAIQLTSSGVRLTATVTNNMIGFNEGDGVQYQGLNTGTDQAGPLNNINTITINNNLITQNERRGINVLNAGDVRTSMTINGNAIDRNQFEGVYIVNTAATTQNVDANANLAMATTTDTLLDPRLALNMNNNVITANGQVANSGVLMDATGLVLRIGSSDGSPDGPGGNPNDDFNNNGGFASTATTASLSGGGATLGQMIRGGVLANIANNAFSGQFGADVTFQAFRSTTNPATTVGAWDNTAGTFEVTTFRQDPLSRLDLRFAGNTGDGLIATRPDVFTNPNNPAFYNNDEPVFKSRTTAQDDPGPFTSGTRRRNLTRLASRAAPFDDPTVAVIGVSGSSNNFLYPGVSGSSTFRRSTDTGNAGFSTVLPGQGFGDDVDFVGAIVGEQEFEWDFLP